MAGRISARWLDGANGVGGEPVRVVESGGLAAAVGSVSLGEFGEEPLQRNLEDLAWLEATARRHHGVIAGVAGRTPAIPMRLATVFHSDLGVAALLAARHEHFTEILRRVAGQAEWGLKVYLGQPGPAQNEAVPASGAGSGAAYLQRRRRELSATEDARRAAMSSAEAIHSTLARLATAAQLRSPQSAQLSGRASRMILNAAYLVAEERTSEFGAAADSMAGRHPGVVIEKTGPWPPYSFATVDPALVQQTT
ncbi:MAG: GvpL/GvpF family gas vesicle protein [Candidatus Dormibacteraeota bacterium]|nr:GvpL/GvpF family gas vesicle protein [Candidatus Dormibacteraeota bacterium]